MKTLADNAFFLVFEEIVRKGRPSDGPDIWSADGVSWRHTRHSCETPGYGFAIEVFEATYLAKPGWKLIAAKEYWWAGRNGDVIRSARWAKASRGHHAAVLAWFRRRQHEI